VSGAPQFFKRAFGETEVKFHDVLLWRQKFIFNRYWYEKSDGKPELDEFEARFARLIECPRCGDDLLG
jgi:hypothetical protein